MEWWDNQNNNPSLQKHLRDEMKGNLKIRKAIIFAILLLLSLPSLSNAESEITDGYDENTEITIKGVAAEIINGMRGPVLIKIKTDAKTYNVVTAPRWYLSRNASSFTAGSILEVTGSKYLARDGNLYIIAQQIKNLEIGQTIILRDSHFRPLWRGRRH